MNNNNVIKVLVLIILLIILNISIFLTLHVYSASRIINIIFINFAFIILWGFTAINTKKKKFKYLNYLKLPFLLLYFIATLIIGFTFMYLNPNSIKETIIAHTINTGVFLILMLINQIVDNHIESNTNEGK